MEQRISHRHRTLDVGENLWSLYVCSEFSSA